MKFEINASFDWCAIFDGKMNSPMMCQLALSKAYSLIYIDITSELAGKDNIDIFKLINEAFKTDLPINTLFVQDAGFYTFSTFEKNNKSADALTIKDVFPDASLPATVSKISYPIADSTRFWLQIRLKDETIFGSLLQIGVNDNGKDAVKDIALSGLLNNTLPIKESIKKGTYSAKLPDFRLFTLFDFTQLSISYRFETSAIYDLKGHLAFSLFGHRYVFDGQVRYTERALQACLALAASSTEKTIPTLFDGAMVGISFNNLIFGLHYRLESDDKKKPAAGFFRVQGTINYGRPGTVGNPIFSGKVYLDGAKPVLASVSIDNDIDIGKIFNQSIPNAHWPSELIDITFKKGSSLYYFDDKNLDERNPNEKNLDETGGKHIQEVDFYCPVAGPPTPTMLPSAGIVYQPGFHLHALFDITIIKTLSLMGDIAIDSNGVIAAIQLANPINIFILQITGISAKTHGPEFNFSSKNKTMGFRCGLYFFQKNFGLNVDVTGEKGEANSLSLKGTLSATQAFPPMFPKPPRLSFSWTKKKGFAVTGWEGFDMDNLAIDLASALKKLSAAKGTGCGEIGNLISDNFTTNFKITPGFLSPTGEGAAEKPLSLVLKGSFAVMVAGSSIGTVNFPAPIVFAIPNDLSMDNLAERIVEALAGAAESFAQGLAENAKAIAVFLAVTAGSLAVKYAATLACQGLVDASAAAAADAAADTLAAGAGIGAAIIAAVSVINRSCFTAGTRVLMKNGETRSIEDIQLGDRLLAGNGLSNIVIGFDRPLLGHRRLYSFNQSQDYFFTAEHPFMTRNGWRAIDPAATRRENETLSMKLEQLQPGDLLVRSGLPDLQVREISSQPFDAQTPLYNFILDGDHTYYANHFLVHNKDPKPPPPQNPDKPNYLSINVESDNVTFSWQAANFAMGYQITLNGPDKNTLLQQNTHYYPTKVSASLNLFAQAGVYLWEVASVRDQFVSQKNRLEQRRLGAMAVQTALINPQSHDVALQLRWNELNGATGYNIRIMQGDTTLPLITVSDTSLSYEFVFAGYPAGEYSFSIQAQGDSPTLPGQWSEPEIWTRLAPPTDLRTAFSGDRIDVQWQPATGAVASLISVYNPAGALLAQISSHSAQAMEEAIPLQLPVIQGAYQLYICGMPSVAEANKSVPSPWVAAPSIEVKLDAGQWAELALKQHFNAKTCASQLIENFPTLTQATMAIAMANGGYLAVDTAQGLVQVWPNITATEMSAALLAAYGATPTLDEIAAQAFHENKDGAECAMRMLHDWPSTPAMALGQAMAKAGYPAQATAEGLKTGYSTISATEVAAILAAIYGTNEP